MSKELTREEVTRECQWLIEEHCQSAARKWDAHDAAQRATIQQLEARLTESEKAAYDIDETIQHQKQTIQQLEAQLNDKDTVPRSRYNVCCDQYNEVRDSLTNVRIVAKTEIQRLEARIKELESQRNPHNP